MNKPKTDGAAAMATAEQARQAKIREIVKPSTEPKRVGSVVDESLFKDNFSPVVDAKKIEEYKSGWDRHVAQWEAWFETQDVSPPPGRVIDEELSLGRSWKKSNVVAWKLFDERIFRLYKARGIPERLMQVDFSDWIPRGHGDEETLNTARTVANKGSGCILFTGPVGVGKSHLGVCVAKQQRDFWMVEHQVLWGIRKKSFEGKKEDPEHRAKSVFCLVLDELELPGSREEILFVRGIIQSRLNRGRLTVITTNLIFGDKKKHVEAETAGEIRTLRQLLGARIVDRLRESGNFVKSIIGASHR